MVLEIRNEASENKNVLELETLLNKNVLELETNETREKGM